jgi:3' terminal RNA ribose 2'-O-methyltransferase Hen1
VLLTIATTMQPATDLGYLLHKNPGRLHTTELGFGTAHVLFTEATVARCQASLLLEIDPVALVRRAGRERMQGLWQYVNDRPYVASSFLSVAVGRMFGTAMTGRSKERPDLAARPIPLEIGLPVLPCRGGEPLLRRMFEPLGFDVTATALALDSQFPSWGDSSYLAVTLTTTALLRDVLEQLYVLLPVLDDDKHYWVGADEVAKLLRRGGEWLSQHPDHELITRRYLRHDRQLTRDALARLFADEGTDPDSQDEASDAAETVAERSITEHAAARGVGLHEQRLTTVTEVIAAAGARRVLDLGCGSGKLIAALLKLGSVQRVTGMDVSYAALQAAARRLRIDRMSPRAAERVELMHGSLTYTDDRLAGYDAAAVVEVIEHLEPSRLGAFEQVLFDRARPGLIVLTTPNAEYNELFESLPAGQLRHADHRFVWTRAQFADWTGAVAARHGYQVRLSGVGPADERAGCPTQLAVFSR